MGRPLGVNHLILMIFPDIKKMKGLSSIQFCLHLVNGTLPHFLPDLLYELQEPRIVFHASSSLNRLICSAPGRRKVFGISRSSSENPARRRLTSYNCSIICQYVPTP